MKLAEVNLMENLVLVNLLANPGETEKAFKTRLTEFWTIMIRQYPEDYQRVFAEATKFETTDEGRLRRSYFVEAEGLAAVRAQLDRANMTYEPIDEQDLYGPYEATSPDWFQLDHD